MKAKLPLIMIVIFLNFSVLALRIAAEVSVQYNNDAQTQKTTNAEQFVSIDFSNVDINLLIKFVSELTGTNFVVDQRVKGAVTVISPSKISLVEAYRVFESVLEVHGYTTVRSGTVVKIIPSPDARSKSIDTMLREETTEPEDRVVTQLIPLKYADSDEIKRLFRPMISKSSVIQPYSPTNTLIVTDVHSNIKRLLKIIKKIDIPGIGQHVSVIPIKYADATKLVNLLTSLFKSMPAKRKTDSEKNVMMVADERTNVIILLASEIESLQIKKLISLMDKETPRGSGKIHVYYCKNATAEELAKILQDLPIQQNGGASKGKQPTVVEGQVRISADKSTNSLIVMAAKEDYLIIEDVIRKLDIPRAMVYIESLIMEVDVNTSLNIGIDWSVFGETSFGGRESIIGGGFAEDFATADDLLQGGLTLGLLTDPVTIAGVSVSNISTIINAVKTNDDFRILSTPQILTTDNEEARITVGENRPYQTRSTTDDSGGTYESFEYRDVGKVLKITPHITENRLVRLTLSLEVTEIDQAATADTSSTLPVTLKRTVDTTVIVKDKQTVVIGGLIDDSTTDNESKAPVLGDLPILGWMFKNSSKDRSRTNLYVFLTPRVIKDPSEVMDIYQEKKGQINMIKEGRGGRINSSDKHSGNSKKNATIFEPIHEAESDKSRIIEPQ